MLTPYDHRSLLVHWTARTLRPLRDVFGQLDPRAGELGISARDFCRWARTTFPRLTGFMVKTFHGTTWQGNGSDNAADVRALTSLDRLRDWLRACNEYGFELHTWVVPVGRVGTTSLVNREVSLLAQVMSLQVDGVGLRSLALDVEFGQGFWAGTAADVTSYWQGLRARLPSAHIAVILDYRFRLQGRTAKITPWANAADSLHPMVYPGEFFPGSTVMPIEREMRRAFSELQSFGKPVVPMLQLHDAVNPVKRRTTAQDITDQAQWAMQLGAKGLTFFRTGTDHFQSAKWSAMANLQLGQTPPPPPPIPANAIVLWPTQSGCTETVYGDNPADAPMLGSTDIYGKPLRYKKTVSGQGATMEYVPRLPGAGAYRIEVFIPAGLANARVEYRVLDRPGQDDPEITTQPFDQGHFANQWLMLGEFDLNPALGPGAGKVSVTDVGPDNPRHTVVFGAVRWVPLERP